MVIESEALKKKRRKKKRKKKKTVASQFEIDYVIGL
jgi:hypothetical protein